MIDFTDPKVLAPVVSLIGLLAFVWAIRHPRTKLILGPPADFWELIRRYGLPLLGKRLPDRIYTTGNVTESQFVVRTDKSPEQVEEVLWANGYKRMPLAAFKSLPDGRKSVGSWAYRDGPLSDKQLHITLFEAENGTGVYAHLEPSAINPLTAYAHFASDEVDARAGVEAAQKQLIDDLV
jgi:hypothetical protein